MEVLVVAAELVAAIRDRIERSAIAGITYDCAAGEALIILQWALDHATGDEVGSAQMLQAALACLPNATLPAAPGELHERWARLMRDGARSSV